MVEGDKHAIMLMIILSVFGGVDIATSQSPDDHEIRFHHITTQDELSHPTVLAIKQDHAGFMWFGTQSGLNRYCGYEITVYQNVAADPYSLNNNVISEIFEDSRNNLWIGTLGGGLHRYDRARDRFIRIVGEPDDWTTLSDNTIRTIFEDSRGNFWIGTNTGLNLMNRDDYSVTRIYHDPGDTNSLSDNNVTVLFEDSRENLWVGTSRGLNLMDRDRQTFTRYQHDPNNPNTIASNDITSIYEDSEGMLWIGTAGGGLNYYDYDRETFGSYQQDGADPHSIPDNYVFSILEDSDGMLWIGSGLEGLSRFNRDEETFHYFQYDRNDPYSIREGGINALYESNDRILWVGTVAGGVSYLDRSIYLFSHYQVDPHDPNGLTNNQIRSFEEDTTGNIWIATDGGGLNRFDPQSGTFTSWMHKPDDPQSVPSDILLALHLNDEGMWLGSYADGLSVMDMEEESFRHFRHDPDDPGSLSDNDVFTIHEDRNGHLWVGTNGGGLNELRPGSDSFVRYMADPDDPESILNNDLRAIHEDRQGRLWIGTHSGDVTELDRSEDRFIHYDINENRIYYNSVIQDFLEDRRDRFWLASRGAGLIQFDRVTGEAVASYTVEDGLPGNMVHGIVEDGQGYLWLSTNHGISRFDPDNETFRNYDENSGVQRSDFFGGARFRDRQGYIYFGGFNGFNRFHPENIQPSETDIPAVITDFLIFNRPVSVGSDAPLDRHISLTDTLTLSHEASVLTFRFSALNFSAVKGNQFSYMLEGFDSDWNFVGSQRTATYTNLDPGEYLFRVRATNNDGVWSTSPTEMVLVITPPFWRSSWFISALLLTVALILMLSYRVRVHSIKTRNIELQERVAEQTAELKESNATKDKLLSILAHDLNNSVFGILGFVELLKESIKDRNLEEAGEYTERLQQVTSYITELLENLLNWARSQSGRIEQNPEPIPLFDLVDDHISQLKSRASNKSIELKSSIDPDCGLQVYADRNMLSTVLRNLLHNALKFTKSGGEVVVDAEPKGDYVEISVSDTGIGMDQKMIDKVVKSGEMASTKGTDNEKGTGLGLSLSHDFIRRHGGQLHIESEKGKGTTIIFSVSAVVTVSDT